jgi:tryptophan synthase alpha chain
VRAPDLEARLRERLDSGGRAFVPYVTGGLPGVDAELMRGLAETGADAIEVGIPFSDPVMDGPVIQEASQRALEGGARLERIVSEIRAAAIGVPVAVMTYLNPVLALGFDRFLDVLDGAVSGAIIPDLPVDEADSWLAAAPPEFATVFLAAPGTSKERLARVAEASRGFVYCVSTYGVTGERASLDTAGRSLVESLRPHTDTPLLVGVGIGTPEAAAEACGFADGVVVGSALVRPILEGDRSGMLDLAKQFRSAIG